MKDLQALRRTFHQYPELSGKEYNTQKKILSFLEATGADDLFSIGNTGVAAFYNGKEEGKSVLIRGDIDALPIQEVNEFAYRSVTDGVSHKCGHDGHTTILCGLAQKLGTERPEKGQAILLFQPAEENGIGARSVIDDPRFERIKPDYVFALHNLPGYPLHQIVYRNGVFNAAVKSMIIKLHGKTSHAAEPEMGLNPATAIAEVIHAFSTLSVPGIEKDNFSLLTPVKIDMGELAYGVSAGYGELHYTLRTWSNTFMKQLCADAEALATQISQKHGLKIAISWTEEFYANENSQEAVDLVVQSARINGLEVHEREAPFKWGEDFGLFTDRFKGAMFGVGSGENCPALHNPDYDFPDEIIESGVLMFRKLIDLCQSNF